MLGLRSPSDQWLGKHRHRGIVTATTIAGSWNYREYDWIARPGDYVVETREELRKCSWPSVDELKGSTVVVMISIALLGAFTVAVDFVLTLLVRFMMTQV